MTIREALDRDVLARNLLEHPFYRAWSAGTLPAEALAAYAREYGEDPPDITGWRWPS